MEGLLDLSPFLYRLAEAARGGAFAALNAEKKAALMAALAERPESESDRLANLARVTALWAPGESEHGMRMSSQGPDTADQRRLLDQIMRKENEAREIALEELRKAERKA